MSDGNELHPRGAELFAALAERVRPTAVDDVPSGVFSDKIARIGFEERTVDTTLTRGLLELLFYRYEAEGTSLYALLDAARDPAIYPLVAGSGLEHACLFSGQLSAETLAVSPFLLRILPGMPTCERIVERGWGRAFGIYLASRAGLHALRRHLRSLLEVRSPERTRLFFRYYDPRVLRSFLPTCDAAQLRELFGPVERFDLEAPDGTELVRFRIVPEPPSATRPSPTLTLRSWTYPLAGWDAASDDRGRLVTLAAPSPAP